MAPTCIQARVVELQAQARFAGFKKELVDVDLICPTACGRRSQVEARLEDLPAEEYEGIPSADLFFEDKVGRLYQIRLCDGQGIAVLLEVTRLRERTATEIMEQWGRRRGKQANRQLLLQRRLLMTNTLRSSSRQASSGKF